MTKQERLMKGVWDIIKTHKTKTDIIASEILRYLDSEGVVIKVNGRYEKLVNEQS